MREGRIVKAVSGFYYVQSSDKVYACKGRGVFRKRKITPYVGDLVKFNVTENDEGYITHVEQRINEFVRPPITNITQAIILSSAVQPTFSTLLLDRFLVLMESNKIKPFIVISKKDLANKLDLEKVNKYKEQYEQIGYDVHFVALQSGEDLTEIASIFPDEITVIIGQTGVGKSTLLNKINPDLSLKTGEISTSLGRGKHTTRHVELIEVNGGLVADTPGFSALQFETLEAEYVSHCFPEMRERLSECRFRGCLHNKEPHCAVKQAVEDGTIYEFRYKNYMTILEEILSRKPRYSND